MPTAVRRLGAALLGLLLSLAGFLVATPSPAPAQPGTVATKETVLYWNDVLLEAFRRQGGGPGPLARAAAMMHAGIYDLINANWWVGRSGATGYRGYTILGFFERSDLEDDDAGFVAAHLLRDALPDQAAFVEQAFQDRYGYDLLETGANDNTRSVLDMIRIAREDDGSEVDTPYPFESVPGAWQLTGHACVPPPGRSAHWPAGSPSSRQVGARPGRAPTSTAAAAAAGPAARLSVPRQSGSALPAARSPRPPAAGSARDHAASDGLSGTSVRVPAFPLDPAGGRLIT